MMCGSGNCYYCERPEIMDNWSEGSLFEIEYKKPKNMIKTFEIKSEFEQGSIAHKSFPMGHRWEGERHIKTKAIHDIIEYVRNFYPEYIGAWWEIYRSIEDEGIFTIENETIKLTEI